MKVIVTLLLFLRISAQKNRKKLVTSCNILAVVTVIGLTIWKRIQAWEDLVGSPQMKLKETVKLETLPSEMRNKQKAVKTGYATALIKPISYLACIKELEKRIDKGQQPHPKPV